MTGGEWNISVLGMVRWGGFSVVTIRTFVICKVAIFSIKHQSPYVDVWYRDIGKRRLCWHCGVLLVKVASVVQLIGLPRLQLMYDCLCIWMVEEAT